MSSTKELAQEVVSGTAYENSVIPTDEFQGCETYVGVVFLGMDNNYSQLLEMCSRAQYKLILVISRDNSLHEEILRTRAEIRVHKIEDVDKRPALPMATEMGNFTLVRQLLECGASTRDRNANGLTPLMIATKQGNSDICTLLLDHGADTEDPDEEGSTKGTIGISSAQLTKKEAGSNPTILVYV